MRVVRAQVYRFQKTLKNVCVPWQYRFTGKEGTQKRLLAIEEKWGGKYPLVIESLQPNREPLSPYFQIIDPIFKILLRQYG
jgi:transposase-like protein